MRHNYRTSYSAKQICHIAMPEPNVSTCQDVGIVANFCPLVVSLLYNKL